MAISTLESGRIAASRRPRLVAIATSVAVPILVLVARATHVAWTATGDDSLIALRTREVGTWHTPLVGPYSRFGWSHPGPLMFFVIAVPYRLFASHDTGLLAGAALVSAVSVIAIVFVIARCSPSPLIATFGVLLVALLVRALGAGFLWNPWNPYVVVLPFLAFVVCIWSAASGESRALPYAVGFGTFVVQSHVALTVEVVVLSLVAVGWLMLTEHAPDDQRRLRRSTVISLTMLVLLWIPPLVQEFIPGGGNIGELLRFWTEPHRSVTGFSRSARLLAPQFAIPAAWFTGEPHVSPFSFLPTTSHPAVPVALFALAIATIVAWRRRDRFALATCSIAVSAVIAGWVSIARIVGPPFPYIVLWLPVLGPVCWFAVSVALFPVVSSRVGGAAAVVTTRAFITCVSILLMLITIGSFTAAVPDPVDSHAADALFAAVLPQLRRLPTPILIGSEFAYSSDAIVGGLITDSIQDGLDVRYPVRDRILAGAYLVHPDAARTRLFVAINDEVSSYARNPSYRLIARYDSLTPAERSEYDHLRSAVEQAGALGRASEYAVTHEADERRLAALGQRALLAAVFIRVPGAATAAPLQEAGWVGARQWVAV